VRRGTHVGGGGWGKRRHPEVTYPEECVALVRAGSVPEAVGLLLATAAAAAAHGIHVVGLPHA
jgi:hypothetical protein